MPEPATQPQQSNQNPNPITNQSAPSSAATNPQEEIKKLLAAVEKFRRTGLVEDPEVTFAKEQILPKLGYSTEQIKDLGPIGIMVKLQEEADKKRLSATGVNTNPKEETSTPETPHKEVAENGKPEGKIETIASNSGNFDELTKQVSQMTDKLSSDIDKEIKRQLEEKKALEKAQEKVDTVLKEHEEISLPQVKETPETPKPSIGLFHTKSNQGKEDDPPIIHKVPNIDHQPESSQQDNVSTDPLAASVDFALNSLKEGDSIGDTWILQKILTTSFGNKKSPFYELLNKSGASWTLSREEMRDVLRSNILAQNNTPVKEIKSEKPEPLHELKNPEEIPEKIVEKDETDTEKREPQIELAEVKEPEEKHLPRVETHKPTLQHHHEEAKNGQQTQNKFSQKQIDFINKIHSDRNLWNTFTSFNPELWEDFHNLYEDGSLSSIGIDAHPLFDKLSSNDFGSMVDIQKGDSASKLLSEAGYNLTWSSDDAEIFAVHIIANHKLLTDLGHKIEVSGLASPTLPSPKDVIELTSAAKNGNNESLHKLQEALNFLPIGARFKLIKPDQLAQLKKYFKR